MPSFTTPSLVLRGMELAQPWAWWRLPEEYRDRRQVALTLDDGPSEVFARRVLDVLKEEDAQATFFVLGDRCEAFPAVLRRMAEEGHGIGLHGDTHLDFTSDETGPWQDRLRANERQIRAALGPELAEKAFLPYFRPPFGHLSRDWAEEIIAAGKTIVNCSILPGTLVTWPGKSNWIEETDKVAARVKHDLHHGAIIALHCGKQLPEHANSPYVNCGIFNMEQAAETVRAVCRVVREAGYEFSGRLP